MELEILRPAASGPWGRCPLGPNPVAAPVHPQLDERTGTAAGVNGAELREWPGESETLRRLLGRPPSVCSPKCKNVPRSCYFLTVVLDHVQLRPLNGNAAAPGRRTRNTPSAVSGGKAQMRQRV